MNAGTSPRPPETAAAHDQSGLLLYEPYYGLSEKPFSLSPDPRFLYQSESHTQVFQDVLTGIRRREGLVVLSGGIGTGKTTLCRSALSTLDRKTLSAFVPDPFVTREDLLKILLIEFGVIPVDDLMRGRLQGASRAELSYPLYEFLRSLEPLDAFAVLLLDEAQNLPVPLLEEIRILSDLEGTRKLLQVVLIGQPEITTALRRPHMRQLQQRVTTQCELQPLTREGVEGYVAHRLTVAGATADRLHFAGDALALVFEASGGVPRVVNRLCDRALQRGHQARSATIGSDLIRHAIDDLQLIVSIPAAIGPVLSPPPALPLAAVLAPAAAADTAVLPAPEFPAEAAVDCDPAALPVAVEPAAVVAPPLSERAPVDRRRPARPGHVEAPRASRTRAAVAASLILLGAMSGATLAFYWAWAGPFLTEAAVMPVVKRPPVRIGAPLPAVLPPTLDFGSDVVEAPPESGDEEPDDPAPSAPVAAG